MVPTYQYGNMCMWNFSAEYFNSLEYFSRIFTDEYFSGIFTIYQYANICPSNCSAEYFNFVEYFCQIFSDEYLSRIFKIREGHALHIEILLAKLSPEYFSIVTL